MKKAFASVICFFAIIAIVCCAYAENLSKLRGYDLESGYQYVQFGSFPQDQDSTVRPIIWRVLSVNDNVALLLSEYILFCNRIEADDHEYTAYNGAFNQTEMFRILNGPFEGNPIPLRERSQLIKKSQAGRIHIAKTSFKEQAFTEDERSMLIADEELGMVFMPSDDDLINESYGFTTNTTRMAYGTGYAIETGLSDYKNGTSSYWTRTQASDHQKGTRCTKSDGSINYTHCEVMSVGCRPMIRLKTTDLNPICGSGTKSDPIILTR